VRGRGKKEDKESGRGRKEDKLIDTHLSLQLTAKQLRLFHNRLRLRPYPNPPTPPNPAPQQRLLAITSGLLGTREREREMRGLRSFGRGIYLG
jgi:hypothetical protein